MTPDQRTGNHARINQTGFSVVIAGTIALTIAGWLMLILGRRDLLVPQWHLGRPVDATPIQLVVALSTLGLYLVASRLLVRHRPWLQVAWSIAGGVAIPMVVLSVIGSPLRLLFACVVSADCTGGFTLGSQLTQDMLHNWPQLMPDWRPLYPHMAISGPGWPLLYQSAAHWLTRLPGLSDGLSNILRPLGCAQWDFNSLSDSHVASAWLGIASPLWTALTAIPLYFLGKTLDNERLGRASVVWWPLVAAPSLFAVTVSPVYALPATTVLALLASSVISPRSWRSGVRLVLAGSLLGLGLLLSLSLVPMLLVCGVLALCLALRRSGKQRLQGLWAAFTAGLQFAAGLIIVYAAYWLLAQHSLLDLVLAAMRIHLDLEQAYLAGVGQHLWDFVIFCGLPLCGLALAYAFSRPSGYVRCLATALAVTLLALLLSGTARREVGRVWILLMPLVVIIAAAVFVQLKSYLRWTFLLAQAAWLLTLAATFAPGGVIPQAQPSYQEMAMLPLDAPTLSTDATFGNELHLSGFQVKYRPESHQVAVALHWQPLRQVDLPYYFSAVLVSPEGRILPSVNWQPFATRYPTSCWWADTSRPESVVDQIALPLDEENVSGDWWLSLSAFAIVENETPSRLPVSLSDGRQDTQLGLGPIPVVAE